MMKKIIVFGLLCLPLMPFHFAQAQQVPLYSQYFENAFIYNPAFAGLDQFGSFNLTHRQQWEGVKGAPMTTLMTLDIPFYEFRSGFGINIHRDQIGFFEQYKAMLVTLTIFLENMPIVPPFPSGFRVGLTTTNRISKMLSSCTKTTLVS